MINTLAELADHFSCAGSSDDESIARLRKTFFKSTTAGLPVSFARTDEHPNGVFTIFPYCEGFDGLDLHAGYPVPLPCTAEQLDAAEADAEAESLAAWNASHGCDACWGGDETIESEYGTRPVDPACPECDGDGIII